VGSKQALTLQQRRNRPPLHLHHANCSFSNPTSRPPKNMALPLRRLFPQHAILQKRCHIPYCRDSFGLGNIPYHEPVRLCDAVTPTQIALSKYMQGAWAGFAKNPSAGPGWPRLGSAWELSLEFWEARTFRVVRRRCRWCAKILLVLCMVRFSLRRIWRIDRTRFTRLRSTEAIALTQRPNDSGASL
jgi:hypothetical protein